MLTNHTFVLTTPSWNITLLDKYYQMYFGLSTKFDFFRTKNSALRCYNHLTGNWLSCLDSFFPFSHHLRACLKNHFRNLRKAFFRHALSVLGRLGRKERHEKNFNDGAAESASGSVDVVPALLPCRTSGQVQPGGAL